MHPVCVALVAMFRCNGFPSCRLAWQGFRLLIGEIGNLALSRASSGVFSASLVGTHMSNRCSCLQFDYVVSLNEGGIGRRFCLIRKGGLQMARKN